MRSLYRISEDLLVLGDLLTELDGEIGGDATGQAIEQWFDEIGEERDRKIDNYCALIREMEERAAARKAEAERIQRLAECDLNAAKRLKASLKGFLDLHQIKKLETDRFKLSVAQNGGKAPLDLPAAWSANPAAAPERYHRHVIEIDREAIRADLESGEPVDGCALRERGDHLRIR